MERVPLLEFLQTVAVASVMFVATNADDLLLLALFFSQPRCPLRSVVLGQLAGIGALTAVSYTAAVLALAIPHGWLPLLGIVPLLIGLRWLRRPITSDSAGAGMPSTITWWSVAGITIANGADNLGVYIPAFAAQTDVQKVITGFSFLVLTLVWCAFAYYLVRHPSWGGVIQRTSRRIAPWVLILLGLWIIAEHSAFKDWL